MDRRKLPFSDVEISRLGLGCMSMSAAYGTPDAALAEATLQRAVELGVTFLDTANVYGMGHNEELIGRVLGPVRDKIQIGTKFGFVPGEGGALSVDGRPQIVRTRCEESLKRLGTDYIDLYYAHRVDPKIPVEDTVAAMGALVTSGLVRAIGLSEVNSDTLRRAHRIHPISAVQSEYSLWNREPETGIIETCRELGVTFVPFSPLGRGMLTGTLSTPEFGKGDMRARMPRFQEGNFEKNRALVTRLEEIARARNCTPAQLALAWVVAQGDDIVPIPGTKRVNILEENVGALDVSLDQATLDELDRLFPIGAAVGERYPAQMSKLAQSEKSA
ncbi:aldo/keto reductase [Iodidimonas sp. SYSU 1G8]|uniref:aldo/keto reductase n=1 Tax=Iodidimonas sp. SYSU 1G8 TaxID=3133967 RepID=UPI0031FE981F